MSLQCILHILQVKKEKAFWRASIFAANQVYLKIFKNSDRLEKGISW